MSSKLPPIMKIQPIMRTSSPLTGLMFLLVLKCLRCRPAARAGPLPGLARRRGWPVDRSAPPPTGLTLACFG